MLARRMGMMYVYSFLVSWLKGSQLLNKHIIILAIGIVDKPSLQSQHIFPLFREWLSLRLSLIINKTNSTIDEQIRLQFQINIFSLLLDSSIYSAPNDNIFLNGQ